VGNTLPRTEGHAHAKPWGMAPGATTDTPPRCHDNDDCRRRHNGQTIFRESALSEMKGFSDRPGGEIVFLPSRLNRFSDFGSRDMPEGDGSHFQERIEMHFQSDLLSRVGSRPLFFSSAMALALCASAAGPVPSAQVDPAAPGKQTDVDRARRAIEGIRAGWRSIHTFHFQYRLETWRRRSASPGETVVTTGELFGKDWKVRHRLRLKTSNGELDRIMETSIDGAALKSYSLPGGPQSHVRESGVWQAPPPAGSSPFDGTISSIYAVVYDGGRVATPMADWLAKGRIRSVTVRQDQVWGELWDLNVAPRSESSLVEATVTLIPQKNFPLLQTKLRPRGPLNEDVTNTFSEFRDHRGILFAHRFESTSQPHLQSAGGTGDATVKITLTFSDVDINGQVADSSLAFDFPKDIPVVDLRSHGN
jgi:hypothetical protein